MKREYKVETLIINYSEESLKNVKNLVDEYITIEVKEIPSATDSTKYNEVPKLDKEILKEGTVNMNFSTDVA